MNNLITKGMGKKQSLVTSGLGFWKIVLSFIQKGFFRIRYALSLQKNNVDLKKQKNFIYPK